MKFIHTSDIHYGIIPDSARDWSKERECAVRSAFEKIIQACSREHADLLLICGDMIHGQPTETELDEINAQFRLIPETRVVIIAGSDDHVIPRSPITSYQWAKNVTYVKESELTELRFDDIGTVVYARSCTAAKPGDRRIETLPLTDPSKINILMVYGGKGDALLFDQKALDTEGYSYGALGGDHKSSVIHSGSIMAVYPGSPEPICNRDTGKHGYYLCEIDPERPKLCSPEFVQLSSIRYSTLVINVTPNTTNEELISSLRPELTKRGTENIYKLKLQGLCDPEISFDLGELSKEFRISEIVDESEPKFDYGKLFSEHPSDIIGLFIQKLNRPDRSDMEKKALSYGVRALLKTSDEGIQDKK